jgi:single-strand selective monofunctional uracil DNA glycosylase
MGTNFASNPADPTGQYPVELLAIADKLSDALDALSFGPPVAYVYNPLTYAHASYALYVERYGAPPKELVLLGMNPGPFGMAQTGVPFGEVKSVRDWLKIEAPVAKPAREHPKRPVEGFACRRSEVSGRRLWGWAQTMCKAPERFFARFFVANYCPLLFLDESGRNLTPDKLPIDERRLLLGHCDEALRETVQHLQPRHVLGVGRFAEQRAREALTGFNTRIGSIPHPSPANPSANRGWDDQMNQALAALRIDL